MLIEDAIQEMFSTFWKKKTTIQIERSIFFYFIRSLRRRILKENASFPPTEDPHELQNTYTSLLSAESQLIAAETVQERSINLQKALNLLSERQKEVIHLRYFQNLSYDEIGSIMDISTSSLYKLVSVAIKKLRQNIRLS